VTFTFEVAVVDIRNMSKVQVTMVEAITKSINRTGTFETKFFRNAFDLEYQNFDEVIAEKYGLDLESFLKYVINENIKR
jgi:hypothetical protein